MYLNYIFNKSKMDQLFRLFIQYVQINVSNFFSKAIWDRYLGYIISDL